MVEGYHNKAVVIDRECREDEIRGYAQVCKIKYRYLATYSPLSFAKQAPVKRSLSAVVLLKIDGVGFNDEQVFDAMLDCAIRKYATSVVTRQWFCNRETRPGAQARVPY